MKLSRVRCGWWQKAVVYAGTQMQLAVLWEHFCILPVVQNVIYQKSSYCLLELVEACNVEWHNFISKYLPLDNKFVQIDQVSIGSFSMSQGLNLLIPNSWFVVHCGLECTLWCVQIACVFTVDCLELKYWWWDDKICVVLGHGGLAYLHHLIT